MTTQHFFKQNPIKEGLKLDRSALEAGLGGACADSTLVFDRLLKVESHDQHWVLDLESEGSKHQIKAHIVVDATGRKRALLNRIGIAQVSTDRLLAFSCHLPQMKPWPLIHGVLVESFSTGWGIVSRLNDTTNVMTLYTLAGIPTAKQLRRYANWSTFLAGATHLKEFLTGDDNTKIMGGDANSSRAAQASGVNWFAIGDAAIAYDPLSSHGISTGIFTAARAAEAIAAVLNGNSHAAEAYNQTLTSIFSTYLQQKLALYQGEKRWPHSAFWQQQQALNLDPVIQASPNP